MTIGVLLLAAGKSRRYGTDKRLARMEDGRRLLDASLSSVVNSGLPVLVCIGRADTELAAELSSRHIRYVTSPNSDSGMGSTLADGLSGAPASWTAVIIGLGDMPMIQPATYRLVAQTLSPGKIVTPVYLGQRGHPVGFDQGYFHILKNLCGDEGARKLIDANPASVVALDVDDPGVVVDVDTPAQLAFIQG
jgi:molybdenum cofactor cytidylyltransferase